MEKPIFVGLVVLIVLYTTVTVATFRHVAGAHHDYPDLQNGSNSIISRMAEESESLYNAPSVHSPNSMLVAVHPGTAFQSSVQRLVLMAVVVVLLPLVV
jgi:hypothetical protein